MTDYSYRIIVPPADWAVNWKGYPAPNHHFDYIDDGINCDRAGKGLGLAPTTDAGEDSEYCYTGNVAEDSYSRGKGGFPYPKLLLYPLPSDYYTPITVKAHLRMMKSGNVGDGKILVMGTMLGPSPTYTGHMIGSQTFPTYGPYIYVTDEDWTDYEVEILYESYGSTDSLYLLPWTYTWVNNLWLIGYSTTASGAPAKSTLVTSGHANGGSATTLIDTTKDFVAEGVVVGTAIHGTGDRAYLQGGQGPTVITAITTTTNPNDTLEASGGFWSNPKWWNYDVWTWGKYYISNYYWSINFSDAKLYPERNPVEFFTI